MKRSITSTKELCSLLTQKQCDQRLTETSKCASSDVDDFDIGSLGIKPISAAASPLLTSSRELNRTVDPVVSRRKKMRSIVTPELQPIDSEFPIIAPLNAFDDLLLPPPSDRQNEREMMAKQFDPSLFEMGPATVTLNALAVLALSHPFEACLKIG